MEYINEWKGIYLQLRGDRLKSEITLDFFVLNGEVIHISNLDRIAQINDPIIYEVIRIIDGIALYMEDHIQRLRKSASLLGYEIKKSDDEISLDIKKLIHANGYRDMNIKLVFSNLNSHDPIFLVFYINSHYPEKEKYQKGIHTILFQGNRQNPNIKMMNAEIRKAINLRIKDEGAYEAILVDKDGFITEGSRSNIFFVKDNSIYTAPPDDVLLGITRNKIISICNDIDVNVLEKNIHIDDLNEFDGAFMTGTSVNVLPISTIDNLSYNSTNNKVIKTTHMRYLKDVENYIRSKTAKEG